MSEPNEKDERTFPINIYALQSADSSDGANFSALGKTWETWAGQEKWTMISNVFDLKNHIIEKCGEKFYIRFLRIGGHGTENTFRLGTTIVNADLIPDLRSVLQEIIPYLKPGKSLVCLDHCSIGNNDLLLKRFSEALGGIPVIAPFGDQHTNEGAPTLEGAARVCGPYRCVTIENPGLAWGI